jgi:opacity protein-like surface antigen
MDHHITRPTNKQKMRNLIFDAQHKRCISFLFLLISSLALEAQYTNTIVTARPGNTVGPGTVGKHIFQSQNGYLLGSMNLERAQVTETNVLNQPIYDSVYGAQFHQFNNVFRYGLFERLEIRYRLNYTTRNFEAVGNGGYGTGNNDVEQLGMDFGLRANFVNNRASGFGFGAQLDVGFDRLLSNPEPANVTRVNFLLLFAQRLNTRFVLAANTGVTLIEGRESILLNRIAIRYMGDKTVLQFGVNADVVNEAIYGYQVNTAYTTGVGYAVNPNLMLDLELSYRIDRTIGFVEDAEILAQQTLAATAGLSWRLNFRD